MIPSCNGHDMCLDQGTLAIVNVVKQLTRLDCETAEGSDEKRWLQQSKVKFLFRSEVRQIFFHTLQLRPGHFYPRVTKSSFQNNILKENTAMVINFKSGFGRRRAPDSLEACFGRNLANQGSCSIFFL